MKKKRNILIIAIIIIIAIGAIVIAFLSVPGVIFLICLITDDGGKLDGIEKISEVVIENQETLQDIVFQVLNLEQDFEIFIDVEEKKFQNMGSSIREDEKSFDLEDIYRLSEELDINEIYAYKHSDVHMVIFQTYSSGLSVSGGEQGFLYIDQDLTEDITEYTYFKVYRRRDYSEIMDNWYYYDISY